MTAQVLEAVPNFSEGRDLTIVQAIVDAMRGTGADVLDWSADPDHNRSVITVVGTPRLVENAALAGAVVALKHIDLRRHEGVHPRIGAIDVLPFVPLVGLDLAAARESAHRVGRRLTDELGLPVYFYGHASDPPGRSLAFLRRGGFEALVEQWPDQRAPDLLPANWMHPGAHPTAGACCVGARTLLLAWNVWVRGVTPVQAREVAASIRESGSGLPGVRALAFELPRRGALQISMNLEDIERSSAAVVFQRLRQLIEERGGELMQTEVIGLIPDQLVLSVATEELRLTAGSPDRMLSQRIVDHLAARISAAAARDE